MSETACTPEAEAVVDVTGVRVTLDGQTVLEDVSLRVKRGQLVALIGPNGSGKTTLLRCMLGLQGVEAGSVRLFGQQDLRLVLPRVAYVPQKLALERTFVLSVREFLCLARAEYRHWFWHSHRRIDSALLSELPRLEIGRLLDQPLARLSGGQLQRVLMAFGLLGKPELLLLDEPTAGIDTPGEQVLYDLLADLHRQQKTVILVSHDLSMVCRHADWVCALNRRVCCEGPPERVMNAESLNLAYGVHASPYLHHHAD